MIAAGMLDNSRAHMPDGRFFLTAMADRRRCPIYVRAELSFRFFGHTAIRPHRSIL
jgi:hypothetical protein